MDNERKLARIRSGVPAQGQGTEVVREPFQITIESPELQKSVTVDFFRTDWAAFGDYIGHSINNDNFEEGIIASAIALPAQAGEVGEREFAEWFNPRMDSMIRDAFVKNAGGLGISRAFIESSLNSAVGYQLAFVFRHARNLFTPEDVEIIRAGVKAMLNSNDLMTVQNTLLEFGDLRELLPANRHVHITSNHYLVESALRGLPEKKMRNKYSQEQLTAARELIRATVTERFKRQIEGPIIDGSNPNS